MKHHDIFLLTVECIGANSSLLVASTEFWRDILLASTTAWKANMCDLFTPEKKYVCFFHAGTSQETLGFFPNQ